MGNPFKLARVRGSTFSFLAALSCDFWWLTCNESSWASTAFILPLFLCRAQLARQSAFPSGARALHEKLHDKRTSQTARARSSLSGGGGGGGGGGVSFHNPFYNLDLGHDIVHN